MLDSIQTIEDIQDLTRQGFSDWARYGDVKVIEERHLTLFTYTRDAQFSDRWNFFERVSRGLIINNQTGEVVARPFDKFFNWLQGGRKARGHIVTVTEKLDGSLGILYRDNNDGDYKIATKGSLDSEQGQWATGYLNDNYDLVDLPYNLTLLFEIIYPDNRIVVDYQGKSDLVLLAARNRFTGKYLSFYPDLYEMAGHYQFTLPKVYQFNNVTEIITQTGLIDANQEGWVVEFSDGSRWKFKGDRYLELHKLISGLSFKWALGHVAGGTIKEAREVIPDEFSNELDEWITEINEATKQIKYQVREAFDKAPRDTRKDFALWVQQYHKSLSPYLFAMLDGRDIDEMIYKLAFRDRREEDA